MDRQALNLVTLAKALILKRLPYIGKILAKLVVVWKPGLNTFAVSSRGHLMIDPIAAVRWGEKEGSLLMLGGIILHESLHVMLSHFHRRGERDPKLWNVATDLAINTIVLQSGFDLPDTGLFAEDAPNKVPTTFPGKDGEFTVPGNMDAFQIYDYLVSKGVSGEDAQAAAGDDTTPASGDCGSGAGGEAKDGEPSHGERDEHGNEIPQTTQAEMDTARQQAAQAIQDAATKGAGSVAGGLTVWAGMELSPPVADWRQIVRVKGRQSLAGYGRGRKSYAQRHLHQSLSAHPRSVIMGVRTNTKCRVLYAIDTSGSMTKKDHLAVLSELAAIQKRAQVWVVACDTEVQGEAIPLPRSASAQGQLLQRMMTGGGGTNFVPIFRDMEGSCGGHTPDLVVVGTDGGGDAPSNDPGVPTIWLITSGGAKPTQWGDMVQLPKDGRAA